MRRVGVLVLSVLAPAAAADAKQRIVAPNVPFRSSNVRPLLTLPVPHPIGARFRDGFMYVTTTEGLTVYDISRPGGRSPWAPCRCRTSRTRTWTSAGASC